MKNFSGVCQAAGADKPLRAFFIWITNIVTLLVAPATCVKVQRLDPGAKIWPIFLREGPMLGPSRKLEFNQIVPALSTIMILAGTGQPCLRAGVVITQAAAFHAQASGSVSFVMWQVPKDWLLR